MFSFKRGTLIVGFSLCVAALSPALAVPPAADQDEEPPVKLGFLLGHVYFTMSAGSPAPPGGTLISHEREYDKFIRSQTVTGALPVQLFNLAVPAATLPPMPSSFQAGQGGQLDFEYGVTRHIGGGITYSKMDVSFTQSEALSGFSASNVAGQPTLQRQTYVFALPIKNDLYHGSIVQALVSFHLNPESAFDPYLAMRFGAVSFTSWAHQGFDVDPYRYFRSPHGSGVAGSVAVGINLHFSREYGLRVEASGQQQVLKSGFFERRTLNTFQIMGGLMVNMTRFSGTDL